MPETAPVVETTSVRRVIPANQSKERSTPEFWEYVEHLKPAEWDRHLLYIYRVEDARNIIMDKCGNYLSMPGGQQVPLNDREALELAIAQKFGGGVFRLILKRSSERVTETRVYTEGPRKMVQPFVDAGTNGNSNPTLSSMSEASSTAQVAGRAMDALTTQERQSAEIGFAAMRTAAEVMQRFGQPSSGGGDDMTRQFMAAMLQRFLAPPPDPLETLTKLLAIMQTVGGGGGGGTPGGGPRDPLFEKILSTGLDRVLNPPSSAPAVSTGAELVRSMPTIVTHITEGVREWRMGTEAQRDALTIQARVQGQPGPRPSTVLPAPSPNPQSQPNAPAETQTMEFIEQKIVEIFNEYPSADEAADEAMSFLMRMSPAIVKQLADLGENGLAGLFLSRPILKQCTNDRNRLKEFIQAFMKYAAEAEGKTHTPTPITTPPPGAA